MNDSGFLFANLFCCICSWSGRPKSNSSFLDIAMKRDDPCRFSKVLWILLKVGIFWWNSCVQNRVEIVLIMQILTTFRNQKCVQHTGLALFIHQFSCMTDWCFHCEHVFPCYSTFHMSGSHGKVWARNNLVVLEIGTHFQLSSPFRRSGLAPDLYLVFPTTRSISRNCAIQK
jgi:hypothetical protein